MNGKIQGIIVCGVCAACLGGMALFLSKTQPKDSADSSSSSQAAKNPDSKADESVVILTKCSDDIISVGVDNEYGSFVVEKPESGKTNWVFDARTDQVILVMPETFFRNCAILIGVLLVIFVLLYLLLGAKKKES